MEDKKYCKFCGEQIDKSSVVCPKCGKKLFRIDADSKFLNIYVWCKKCCEEIKISEPKSLIIKKD